MQESGTACALQSRVAALERESKEYGTLLPGITSALTTGVRKQVTQLLEPASVQTNTLIERVNQLKNNMEVLQRNQSHMAEKLRELDDLVT